MHPVPAREAIEMAQQVVTAGSEGSNNASVAMPKMGAGASEGIREGLREDNRFNREPPT